MTNFTRISFLFTFCLCQLISMGQDKVSVKVFPELSCQTIQSIGANYTQTRYSGNAWDAIGGETLRQFRPGVVRLALPLKIRNTPYAQVKGALLLQHPLVISLLEEMKRMKQEFGVHTFILSCWDVPNELVVDPTRQNQRVIKPEAYDEVLDMLVAFLVKAKEENGTEVNYFSFNESDGGWQVQFSPQATIAFIKKAMARFKGAGLNTQFLLADTGQTKGTVEFATMIMADSTIWKGLGPLSFHSWWSEKMPDAAFEQVAAFAKAWNKPVWCCESGFDAEAYKIKGMVQSWDYALRYARIAYRVLKYSRAEVLLYWTWQNDYPIMSMDLKTRYPSYWVTKQLTDYLNAGTRLVQSISSDPEVLVLSGFQSNGSRVLQLINMKKEAATIDVEGFTGTKIDQVATTEAMNWEEVKGVATSHKGHTQLKLKPASINTFLFH